MKPLNECYLCNCNEYIKRPGEVRDNPTLEILECKSCGLVFLSSAEHITDNFYHDSGMHDDEADFYTWRKNSAWDDERRFNYVRSIIKAKNILDFGCGNGGFLSLAKKDAKRAVGVEVEKRLDPYFKQEELEVYSELNKITGLFDVVTLFHVLEHIADPVEILKKLSKLLERDGQLIVEVPNADDVLLKLYKCDAFSKFTYWSCHLFLFTEKTLAMIADRAGLNINYIKQIQRYPLSNHLYWLAVGKPGGHEVWGFLDSVELKNAYEKQLSSIGACDTIIASFSKD